MAYGGDRNRNMIVGGHRVTKGRNEAAFLAVILCARLGIIGDPPGSSVEGRHHAGLGGLEDLAVVGGVGLP